MTTARADAGPFVPEHGDLAALAEAAANCRGCSLYQAATQTVFGQGPGDARVVLVGEQPGDREDLAGEPFVGPAGNLLGKVLDEVRIDRRAVYITNAVKHFKFVPAERGKRRIHKPPSRTEVVACRPWLLAELHRTEPEVVVALGATAAKSLLGPDFKVTEHRGKLIDLPADLDGEPIPSATLVATVHPSAVLRSRDRETAYRELADDLRVVASILDG